MSYKPGPKHGEADRLSRAPVEPEPEISVDDDVVFLGAVDGAMMGRMHHSDVEIRAVLNHLENQGSPSFVGAPTHLLCAERRSLQKQLDRDRRNLASARPRRFTGGYSSWLP